MNKITIYTSPTCGFCKMTKEFLGGKELTYTEKDVTTDGDALKVLTDQYHAHGVPLIVIEKNGQEEVIHGFDQQKLSSALEL